jgi:hypothetical protein
MRATICLFVLACVSSYASAQVLDYVQITGNPWETAQNSAGNKEVRQSFRSTLPTEPILNLLTFVTDLRA